MSANHEIISDKIVIQEVFSKWYNIPSYQRPYVWGTDEVNDLLDDLTTAQETRKDAQYFLGTYVYQTHKEGLYEENDILDGQQRLTTLLLLFAVLRDIAVDTTIKNTCQGLIFQEGNKILKKPELTRLKFAPTLRGDVISFVNQFINKQGGTGETDKMEEILKTNTNNQSLKNMIQAIRIMYDFFKGEGEEQKYNDEAIGNFLQFLLNNVVMIYVATEDLDDAFRLFTVLNNRGVQLRNSDILKAENLNAVTNEQDRLVYASFWEEIEKELGDDFDLFLNYIRTILLKDKARLNLLREFNENIYNAKRPLLKRGAETFAFVKKYWESMCRLFDNPHNDAGNDFSFDNLLLIMRRALPFNYWIPPLLYFYDRFQMNGIREFLHRLNAKGVADWLCIGIPTTRIENMGKILRVIENANNPDDVLSSDIFAFDGKDLISVLNGNIYGRKFALYIVLMMDFLRSDQTQRISIDSPSIEHILPQTPSETSQWVKDFTEEERDLWTNKLGNLVLLTGRKNASQGRLDYQEKKSRYFKNRITIYQNSLHVLQNNNEWKPANLQANHEDMLKMLKVEFGIKE